MGWYNKVWTRRVPITLLDISGVASADFFVTIPKGFDDFWNTVDSSAAEIRVVSGDGETVLEYYVDDGAGGAFSKTNRLGRLKLNDVTLPSVADSAVLAWLYYGSTSNQGSGAGGGSAPGSGSDGYIDLWSPRGYRFTHHSQVPQQTRPRYSIHKRVDEEVYVNVVYTGVLANRSQPGHKSRSYEEPYYATGTVINTSNVAQASMIDATRHRFFDAGNGNIGFRMVVKGGTSTYQYTALPDLRTTLPGASSVHQRMITSIGIYVRDTAHT